MKENEKNWKLEWDDGKTERWKSKEDEEATKRWRCHWWRKERKLSEIKIRINKREN